MRKICTIVIMLLLSLTLISGVSAAPKSIDTVMSEIRIEQGVDSNDQINPDRVSQVKLEELGDSVMEAMIGNSEIHEQMDERMGGEGSASLTAMHIRMGYNYLADYPYGMMRPGNSINSNWNGMMGFYGWAGVIIMGLFLFLLIVVLIAVLRRLVKKPLDKSAETPLDILKKRYVLGEITSEEYEKIREELLKESRKI